MLERLSMIFVLMSIVVGIGAIIIVIRIILHFLKSPLEPTSKRSRQIAIGLGLACIVLYFTGNAIWDAIPFEEKMAIRERRIVADKAEEKKKTHDYRETIERIEKIPFMDRTESERLALNEAYEWMFSKKEMERPHTEREWDKMFDSYR